MTTRQRANESCRLVRTSKVSGIAAGVLAVVVQAASSGPVAAQGIPLIRDTEIETLLRDYARPIFKVAGLGANNIAMRIVRHDSFNAFVVDGRNVFMNSGTLMQAKSPNEVIGVIAHETGHITGGHLSQLRSRIARDQTKALLVTVLGLGALIAGAASSSDSTRELGNLGQGVALGGNDMLMRSLLSERRAQESAADQAGLNYLLATRQSGRGMLATFERFAQQEYISDQHKDPFVRSHPVATDRLRQLRDKVEASPHANAKDEPSLQLRHDMMRAKIAGFLDRPQTVANRYPATDASLPARYARAISSNCSGRCAQNIALVDALLKEQPASPYFWELRGHLMYFQGQYRDAVPAMRKALQLAGGDEPLMMVNLAQALLGTEDNAVLDEAIGLLRRAAVREGDYAAPHHHLAKAFYRKGQHPQADLSAAQAHFIEGNVKQAQIFAKRAQTRLPQGSPEWIKAEDIITYKQRS